MLQCAAQHGTVPAALKRDVVAASRSGKKGAKGRQALAETYAAIGRAEKYLVATSQAVDVISGGVKGAATPLAHGESTRPDPQL